MTDTDDRTQLAQRLAEKRVTILHPTFKPQLNLLNREIIKKGSLCCWTSTFVQRDQLSKLVEFNGFFILTSDGAKRVSSPQPRLKEGESELVTTPNLYVAEGIFIQYSSRDQERVLQEYLNLLYLNALQGEIPILRNFMGPYFNSSTCERIPGTLYDDEVISRVGAFGRSGALGMETRNYLDYENLSLLDIQVFRVGVLFEESHNYSTRTYVQSIEHIGDSSLL